MKDAIKKYNGIDLIVKKSNLPAINLYKKNGFVCIKFEDPMSKKYYWMKLKTKLTKNDEILEG